MADEQGRLLASGDTPDGGTWRVAMRASTPTIFADGIYQLQFAPSVCKLHMFSVERLNESGPTPVEEREHVVTIAMPTATLFEFIGQIIPSLAAQLPKMEATNKEAFEKLRAISEGLIPAVTKQNFQ